MQNYNEENIKNLLIRFMEGQTSEAEEDKLKDYFTHCEHIPEEWEDYKELFCSFETDAFDFTQERVDAMFVAEPAKKRAMWPWLVAACVIGALMMLITPPKFGEETDNQIAKVEKTVKKTEKSVEKVDKEPQKTVLETAKTDETASKAIRKHTKIRKQKSVEEAEEEPVEEPVRMSEETRQRILLASMEPQIQSEALDMEESIAQLRMRGQRVMSMYAIRDKVFTE